jgi:hypothetical protein
MDFQRPPPVPPPPTALPSALAPKNTLADKGIDDFQKTPSLFP